MDATDQRILASLQRAGRISNQDLAQQVGISTAACWRRVRALETAGTPERRSSAATRARLCAALRAKVSPDASITECNFGMTDA